MIWGFNPLIAEGDGGRGLESQGMWLRTARGVHISLTRQQGPPSVLEVGSAGPTLARVRVERTGMGEAGGGGGRGRYWGEQQALGPGWVLAVEWK